ncbi:alpha-L-rhamnosidase C-terminal domain-containing protein [Paenibacillus sp. 2RAB27]|uniref:alpha-L-rhamnosidase C-terminal domain-containing protein n=1 Tax=Paenibacillus sp. 2RAB27 TaxID=3232991 RepID=UPI003F9D491C
MMLCAEKILSYWGGMMERGATSFWEEYDPTMADDEHYGMYGMPFGKSLCHAWGASPIYLIGKYFLGVKPVSQGYETFVVEPHLGGLAWLKGTVPTAKGEVELDMNDERICVRATVGQGVLRYDKHGEKFEVAIPSDGSWLEVCLV